MRHILLIEDSPEVQIVVKNVLMKDFLVSTSSTASSAWGQLEKTEFDLILLDVSLPDGDGFKFCAMLKESSQVPVVFLSGRNDVSDKVMAFSLGASDYISKPFVPLELHARIKAHLRDFQTKKQNQEIVRKNDLCFNILLQTVTLIADGSETELNLTPTEYKLILYLARHPDQIFTRNQILDALWGGSISVVDRTVDVHISNLRKKLSNSHLSIICAQGVGYRLSKKI